MPVELIIGPSVRSMSRTAAEAALQRNPAFPKGAEYTISQHAGHYIAAFHVEAGPFDGPAESEESVPPKSEGPAESAPSEGGESESKPPSDSEGGDSEGGESSESKPPSDKGDAKGGEHKELAHLQLLIQAIADALGVSVDAGLGSPVPGADDPMGAGAPPVPPAGPAGPAGPPAPPHGGPAGLGGPGGNEHVIHEKSGPPMPPTFASTEHPWGHLVGQVPHFRVAEEIGDQDVAEVESELQALASAGGFQVRRAKVERTEDGKRIFSAIIKTPQA